MALTHLSACVSPVRSTIILDLNMPLMDGRTYFGELRVLTRRTPVMLLSAFDAEAAQRELGAEAAMSKPFDPVQLTDHVQQLLRSGRRWEKDTAPRKI
jgi:DNA-binding response OmpR family regulator